MATKQLDVKDQLVGSLKAQGGYTVSHLLSELIEKAFNLKNKGITNVIVGLALPLIISKFTKWEVSKEFLSGFGITAFDGAATLLQNMTAEEGKKKEVSVNSFLTDSFGLKGYNLGSDEQYQLPNGLIVMALPNGNYMDQQGNVYTYAQIQQIATSGAMPMQQGMQQIMPVAGFGDDEEDDLDDEDIADDYDLLMDELDREIALQGDDDEEDVTRVVGSRAVTLNGTRSIDLH